MENERYKRQIALKGFGNEAQQKLLCAKVLVIGAGGLGCPVLQYLAAAGIGKIGVVDDDAVSLSNLHRQVLFSTQDIGLLKAERAAFVLKQMNPEIEVVAFPIRLTTENCLEMLQEYDIIIDGTDNFETRYMINDACVLLNKTLVYGAVSQFEGQVAVFNAQMNNETKGVNYRDLFPEPPNEGEILNCEEAGVLGVLPGITGLLMANETIKLITGNGIPLLNKLLTYNALTNAQYIISVSAGNDTSLLIPDNAEAFKKTNYNLMCTSKQFLNFEIGSEQLNILLKAGNIELIDVREKHENADGMEFANLQIPLSQLNEKLSLITKDNLVTFCESGKRSLLAAKILHDAFGSEKNIYSLHGGIHSLKKYKQAQNL
ncbi:MAG: HesA/MoeB/ThiF family protein [Bacteroidota bacterium]|nr:HesA/MoeB/ThiF family protein [Bacteroidota bacterium]